MRPDRNTLASELERSTTFHCVPTVATELVRRVAALFICLGSLSPNLDSRSSGIRIHVPLQNGSLVRVLEGE